MYVESFGGVFGRLEASSRQRFCWAFQGGNATLQVFFRVEMLRYEYFFKVEILRDKYFFRVEMLPCKHVFKVQMLRHNHFFQGGNATLRVFSEWKCEDKML